MSWIPNLPEASGTCHCGQPESDHGWLASGLEDCGGFIADNWPKSMWSPWRWL